MPNIKSQRNRKTGKYMATGSHILTPATVIPATHRADVDTSKPWLRVNPEQHLGVSTATARPNCPCPTWQQAAPRRCTRTNTAANPTGKAAVLI